MSENKKPKRTQYPYLNVSIWTHVWLRLPWLIVLLFGSVLAGALVTFYEPTFLKLPLLVAFIPLIMAIAGAGGSQTSTVIIRSMVTGEITTKKYLKAFLKEFIISVIIGIALGALMFGYVISLYQNIMLGIVLWLGLIATVIFAKILGMFLPIMCKWLKIDPAMVASPVVTITADIFGIFAFFTFAQLILGV